MPNVGDIIRAEDFKTNGGFIGQIIEFPSNLIPSNTLLCDGAELSREAYPELFAVINTIYGEGDGSTTFNIPDYRGAFLRCIGGNADEMGVLQEDATDVNGLVLIMQRSRTSSIRNVNSGNNLYPFNINGQSNDYYNVISDSSTTSASGLTSTDIETRPSNYAINICIVFE